VGGNDRSIAFYGDDTDLARRLHAVGKTIWRNNFNTYTSARRFDETGLVRLAFTYMLNYWWPVIFHRPYTVGVHYNKAQGNTGTEA
jgi:GT2 family glycosyltransferase